METIDQKSIDLIVYSCLSQLSPCGGSLRAKFLKNGPSAFITSIIRWEDYGKMFGKAGPDGYTTVYIDDPLWFNFIPEIREALSESSLEITLANLYTITVAVSIDEKFRESYSFTGPQLEKMLHFYQVTRPQKLAYFEEKYKTHFTSKKFGL